MRIKLFTLWMMVLGCAIRVAAQETTSEIQGLVSASSGMLAGATITAVHQPTNTTYTTTSRTDGRYNLPNLKVGGPYTIRVTYVGFTAGERADVTLTLGQVFKADFTLTDNAAQLTGIVVTGSRQDKVFNRNRTGSAETVTRSQIERLPTINRSLQDFTRLTPTANGTSFGGRSSSYNSLTVNGASFNNTFGLSGTLGGQTNSQPISLDAIEQIQVSLAPYDVTLGNFTGAGINSVTRSGTNSVYATVYGYKKTPGLTGRQVGATKIPKQDFDFNNRGLSFGLPIIKNKLFIFVSGEQQRESAPATNGFTASRNGSSGAGISQAKAEDLEQLADFLRTKYNYNPGAFENYTYDTYSDKVTARIDLNIDKRNTLNVNYYYLKSYRNSVPSSSGAPSNGRSPNTNAMPFFSSSYIINNDFNIFIAELNTRFSNSVSNKLQVGYNRLRDYRSSPGGVFPMVDIENGAGLNMTSFGYEPFTAFNQLNTDTWQFNDVVSVYKGRHTLTFGTQNTYNKFLNGFAPNYYGTYRFKSLADFYESANNGTPLATRYEFRQSTRKGGAFPFAEIESLQLGLFAQDKYNVNEKLTLTLGLRADMPIFTQNFISNTNADALTFRNGQKIETGRAPKNSILFSPRAGFNWDVKGDRSMQVRGGAGVFAGAPPFVWISNQASNNGVDFGSYLI
ncbi:MAG: TonB-dependent receptor, partial [Chitinophagaceae bacterium]